MRDATVFRLHTYVLIFNVIFKLKYGFGIVVVIVLIEVVSGEAMVRYLVLAGPLALLGSGQMGMEASAVGPYVFGASSKDPVSVASVLCFW